MKNNLGFSGPFFAIAGVRALPTHPRFSKSSTSLMSGAAFFALEVENENRN